MTPLMERAGFDWFEVTLPLRLGTWWVTGCNYIHTLHFHFVCNYSTNAPKCDWETKLQIGKI